MNAKTALDLIAAIESAIRSLELDKPKDWSYDVDDLTDMIKEVADKCEEIHRCEFCHEFKEGRIDDQGACVSCSDENAEWEGILPDGSVFMVYRPEPCDEDY